MANYDYAEPVQVPPPENVIPASSKKLSAAADTDWTPLLIEDPCVLMKYYDLKFTCGYGSDCEFLMVLLELLETHRERQRERGVKQMQEDGYLPLECIIDDLSGFKPKKRKKDKEKKKFPCYLCVVVELESAIALKDHFQILHPDDKPFRCVSCKECFPEHTELKEHCRKMYHEGFFRCDQCDKTFFRKDRFQDHNLRWHTDGKHLSCNHCDRTYATRGSLLNHMKSSHPHLRKNRRFLCYKCPGTKHHYDTARELKNHFEEEHPDEKPFKCVSCGELFKECSEYRDHAKKLNHKGFYRCEPCDKTFFRKDRFQEHKHRWHRPGKLFRCKQCVQTFFNKNALQSHRRSEHGATKQYMRTYACTYCNGLQFENGKTLKEHLRLIHPDKPCTLLRKRNLEGECDYACYICPGMKFETPNAVKEHFQMMHPDCKPFKCAACYTCYPELNELRQHVKRTDHKGLFPCERCDKAFNKICNLRTHIQRWHGSQRFPCDQCDKSYTSEASLYLHKHAIHRHPDKNICDECGKKCHNSTVLKEHKQTHQGIRHACHICKKMFLTRTTLKSHMKYTHSNLPKTHGCELCGKMYRTTSDLKSHLRVHNKTAKSRDFRCDQCHKAFVSKGRLNFHLKKHHNAMEFVCEVCSKPFQTQTLLRDHLRTHSHPQHPHPVMERPQPPPPPMMPPPMDRSMERPFDCTMRSNEFKQVQQANNSLYTYMKLQHGFPTFT